MIYIFFLLFILGTCLGSFISCVAYRYKLGISIIYPRSFCDNCSQTLQHWQLIPIIGFILQKGKCHFCKQKIPLSSTVIELAIGVIFIFNTIIIANTNLIFTSLLVVWLTLVSLEDYYTLYFRNYFIFNQKGFFCFSPLYSIFKFEYFNYFLRNKYI